MRTPPIPSGPKPLLTFAQACSAFAAIVLCVPAAAEPAFITPVGPPPQPFNQTAGVALSADGQTLVGNALQPNGISAAFIFGPSQIIELLLPPPGLTSTAVRSCSGSADILVGSAFGAPGIFSLPMIWTRDLGTRTVALPMGPITEGSVNAVSDDGSVAVGYGGGQFFAPALMRWSNLLDPEGAPPGLLITLPGGISPSEGRGISADGLRFAGPAATIIGPQGYIMRPEGVLTIGDLPGGSFNSVGQAISRDGQFVVGSSRSSLGTEAVMWSQQTGIVALGDLPGGATSALANACSLGGQVIVGTGTTAAGNEAFVWSAVSGMRRLADVLAEQNATGLPDWFRLRSATAVSADGLTIAGTGVSAQTGAQLAYRAVLERLPDPPPPPPCSLGDIVGGDGNPPQDGQLDGNDFVAFLNAFGGGALLADLVGGDGNPPADGSVDGNDFTAFLNAFGAGC